MFQFKTAEEAILHANAVANKVATMSWEKRQDWLNKNFPPMSHREASLTEPADAQDRKKTRVS
jgi:hypothetical protein